MKNETLFFESNSATYCPEDNKLRLYVGRVPRDEYEALKAEGWTSTPKQDCDFVAHWTPARRDTCLSYAGFIDDEDTPPTERLTAPSASQGIRRSVLARLPTTPTATTAARAPTATSQSARPSGQRLAMIESETRPAINGARRSTGAVAPLA